MSEKIEWYKEVLELEPNSRVFFPLARMLSEAGRTDEAAAVLEKGLERHPEYLEARLFLIELLFSNNKSEACNLQVRQLSRMFASYAGFWQAWAACLAQEPSEEDAASMLRFLAANFISGPLRLHDVINKGLQAIMDEKRNAENPAAYAEAEAAERLLARDVAEDAALAPEHVKTASSPLDIIPESPALAVVASEVETFAETSQEILPENGEDALLTQELMEEEAPTALMAADTPLPDENELPFEMEGVDNESAVLMAQAGTMVAEETSEMADDAAEGAFAEIVAEEDGEESGAAEALAAEIPEGSSRETLEDNVASILETAQDEDLEEPAQEEDVLESEAAEFVEEPVLPTSEAGDLLQASPEPLADLDIPEVPDLDAAGDYSLPTPSDAGELTESGAFDALIDGLADQSRELSSQMDDLAAMAEDSENGLTLDLEEELDGIFNEPAKKESPQFLPDGELLENGDNGEEKISLRTRSMAEVLAEQGDIKGALDIYHELAATAADDAEAEDIRRRMATLTAKLERPDPDQANGESEKLIGMLEALAKRVEARVAN